MSNITSEIENITDAISECTRMEQYHKHAASRLLMLMLMIGLAVVLMVIFSFMANTVFKGDQKTSIPDSAIYAMIAIYTLTFSVSIATYKMHINEAVKLQFYAIGFMRIRVAGSNTTEGYKTEVRTSLTKDAFKLDTIKQNDKIKSPIEGHPGSDFAAAALNKVIDGIEVVGKSKSKKSKSPIG